ncbi:MAG: hypothetical protein Q8K86_09620 [Candidatus Nanopelagicaceae bacterium]|nr:hypothetical protein [Candidatus Nanopelagicaceae bacterium]
MKKFAFYYDLKEVKRIKKEHGEDFVFLCGTVREYWFHGRLHETSGSDTQIEGEETVVTKDKMNELMLQAGFKDGLGELYFRE